MSISREPIYAALFALAAGSAGYVTKSRKLRHWNEVRLPEQPALFQAQRTEKAVNKINLPTVWTLSVDLYIYVRNPSGVVVPASSLNPMLDALDAALKPDVITGRQTLGGLVEHCAISGVIQTDEGTLGEQMVAIVPIEILLAG